MYPDQRDGGRTLNYNGNKLSIQEIRDINPAGLAGLSMEQYRHSASAGSLQNISNDPGGKQPYEGI